MKYYEVIDNDGWVLPTIYNETQRADATYAAKRMANVVDRELNPEYKVDVVEIDTDDMCACVIETL